MPSIKYLNGMIFDSVSCVCKLLFMLKTFEICSNLHVQSFRYNCKLYACVSVCIVIQKLFFC